MKKQSVYLIAAIVILGACKKKDDPADPVVPPKTAITLANPSFESGATGWTLIENDINEPLNSIDVDSSTASQGNQSIKFHHNSLGGCYEMWVEQVIPLTEFTAGATYEFSMDYMSQVPIPASGMNELWFKNSTFNIEVPLDAFLGDSVWHNQTFQFTLPANIGSNNPKLMIHYCNSDIKDWWIDNVTLTEI